MHELPDDKETKQFCRKIWGRREHNRKAEWISYMEKSWKDSKMDQRQKYITIHSKKY